MDDRRDERVDRDEQLRSTLRADPVALAVATCLGTTERGFELLLAVACAVVLEGAAIVTVAAGVGRVQSRCGHVSYNSKCFVDKVRYKRQPLAFHGAITTAK